MASLYLTRKTKAAIWSVMLSCWVIQGLAARHSMGSADGVSYQNIADACLHGNWHALVNGYWSPGYPFLLSLWFRAIHPSPYYVPLVLRCFTILTLLLTLGSLEYFLYAFFRLRHRSAGRDPEDSGFLSDAVLRIACYGIFLWITIFLTPASLDHPDIWVFAVYLLASGISLEIVGAHATPWRFGALGMVLGAGYLMKAVMLPLSAGFVASLMLHKQGRVLPKLALTFATFCVVAAPFVSALSREKGRLTFGDSGALNYLPFIDDTVKWPNTGQFATEGERASLIAAPHIAKYTNIVRLGTYPQWADPSFGYRPVPFHFHLGRQINRTHIVLRYYFDLWFVQLGSLVCGVIILFLLSRPWALSRLLFEHIAVWFPAIAGFALYAIVRAEPRFFAGFTFTLVAAALASPQFHDREQARRCGRSFVFAVGLLLGLQIAVRVGRDAGKLLLPDPYPDWAVAQSLRDLGVQPGDRVSYLGETITDHVWAYLAHVSVVAEIPKQDVDSFWAASEAQKEYAMAWLAKTGAKVLVTRDVPASAIATGWVNVRQTDCYILELPKQGFAPRNSRVEEHRLGALSKRSNDAALFATEWNDRERVNDFLPH